MDQYNGRSFWQEEFVLAEEIQLFTDAAGLVGFGAFLNSRWCAKKWHPTQVANNVTKNMVLLELFPGVVSVVQWGEQFKNKRIMVNTYNKGVLYAVHCLA